jgi:hypothetical protein
MVFRKLEDYYDATYLSAAMLQCPNPQQRGETARPAPRMTSPRRKKQLKSNDEEGQHVQRRE